MPTTYEEGDYATLKIDVPNTADSTEVAVRVLSPSGVETTPIVSREGITDTWSAEQLVNEPGLWRVWWTVDGDGHGVEGDVVSVAPSPFGEPSSGRLYATTADYARYIGGAPSPDAVKTLSDASADLDQALIGALYATDDDEMPTHPRTRQAFRDACCAQAYFTEEGGETDEDLGGLGQISIGSISLTSKGGSASSANNTTGAPIERYLSSRAERYLREAGLLPIKPHLVG